MTGEFPKCPSGRSWTEEGVEAKRLIDGLLKSWSNDMLLANGTLTSSYSFACQEAERIGKCGAAVVVPIKVVGNFAAIVGNVIIQEMARREAEFNRAAAQ